MVRRDCHGCCTFGCLVNLHDTVAGAGETDARMVLLKVEDQELQVHEGIVPCLHPVDPVLHPVDHELQVHEESVHCFEGLQVHEESVHPVDHELQVHEESVHPVDHELQVHELRVGDGRVENEATAGP